MLWSRASRRTLTLAATIAGSSIAFLDANVVVVALPTIQHEFDLGLAGQQWILLSYSLALASLYLVGGAIGDRQGRRRVFVAGAIGFALASALAGLAPNEGVLIVARFLQGVAGAFLTTNSLALLRSVYGREAGRAVGLWTAFTSAAAIAGTPAGGAIVEWVSWRWIFYLNLPLAGAAVALALAGRCPEEQLEPLGRLDIGGALLAALGFGSLTYTLVDGAEEGFGRVWWTALLGAAALVSFVFVERRAAEPLLPFELFRRRNFATANAETFLTYGALGGAFLFFTLYLQFLGFSPLEAALANVPATLLGILLAPRFGALADRHGPRLYLAGGPALMGVGFLILLALDERSDFWTAGLGGLALFSIGIAMLVAPITATALSSVPERYAGVASGVNATVSRLGSLIAVAAIGAVVTLVYQAGADAGVPLARGQTDPALRAASKDAFDVAMLIAAALALGGAVIAWLGISDADARRESEPSPGLAAPVGAAGPRT